MTEYCGSGSPNNFIPLSWWLRTPGYRSEAACDVDKEGSLINGYSGLGFYGESVGGGIGVRPALKLNLSASLTQSKTKCNYQLKVVDDATRQPIGGAERPMLVRFVFRNSTK